MFTWRKIWIFKQNPYKFAWCYDIWSMSIRIPEYKYRRDRYVEYWPIALEGSFNVDIFGEAFFAFNQFIFDAISFSVSCKWAKYFVFLERLIFLFTWMPNTLIFIEQYGNNYPIAKFHGIYANIFFQQIQTRLFIWKKKSFSSEELPPRTFFRLKCRIGFCSQAIFS